MFLDVYEIRLVRANYNEFDTHCSGGAIAVYIAGAKKILAS